MIRIAIVEDEESAANALREFLERYQKDGEEGFQITWFQDAVSFLAPYRGFDLVFMDISMPYMDGMAVALRLRQIDAQTVLIFVTNMAQYAVQGYEANALDFVIKPLVYSDFVFKMKRALNTIRAGRGREIVLQLASGLQRINSNELVYVEIRGHTLIYHLLDQNIETRGTIAKAEEQLNEWGFLRCNNCYLVNPRHIEWVRGYVVKVSGEELQISHPRRKEFMRGLSEWFSIGGL